MLDYYGSIMKDQSSIYSEITDRFSEYKSSYIKGILDEMYSSKYLNDEISISGWMVFIQKDVVSKIKERIEKDTKKAEYRLLVAKLFDRNEYYDDDVVRVIADSNPEY